METKISKAKASFFIAMVGLLSLVAGIFSGAAHAYVPYSVTTGTNKMRIEAALVFGSNTTPTVSTQSSNWTSSIIRNSAGNYTITLQSGIFSAVPWCVISQREVSGAMCGMYGSGPNDATHVTSSCYSSADPGSTGTDATYNIICFGPR